MREYLRLRAENRFGGSHPFKESLFLLTGVVAVAFCFYCSVLPVSGRWGECEQVCIGCLPALCLAGAVCLMSTRPHVFSVCDMLVLAWTAYCFLRMWFGAEYPCRTEALKAASLFLFYVSLRAMSARCAVPSSVLVVLFLTCACYESLLGLWQVFTGTGHHFVYQLTGSFQNPGPYSAYPLMGACMGLVLADGQDGRFRTKYLDYAVCAATVICVTVLAATWSRAAYVSLGIVVLLIYRKKLRRWSLVVALCVIAAGMALYFMKQGSADGRLLTWSASLGQWLQHPWTGVGLGGFRNACAEGISMLYVQNPGFPFFYAGNVAEYAFCDFVKVLVEQGVAGGLLCVCVVAVAMYDLFRWDRALFYGFLALLSFSLFSYPFSLYPYALLAVSVMAFTPHQPMCRAVTGWMRRAGLGVAGLFVFAVSVCLVKGMEISVKADSDYRSFAGMEHAVFLKDYYRLLPVEEDNPVFLFGYAKLLAREHRYNDSNDALYRGTLVSNDPMFYVLQGKNYQYMGAVAMAEQAYKKAFSVMPNRIYPLYRLLLLYAENGNTRLAHATARRIVGFREKTVSAATKKMKEHAKRFLETGSMAAPDKKVGTSLAESIF